MKVNEDKEAYTFEVLHTYREKDNASNIQTQMNVMGFPTRRFKKMSEKEALAWNTRNTPSEEELELLLRKSIDSNDINGDMFNFQRFCRNLAKAIKQRIG